ncbi:hypothetical protein ACFWUW_23945 [Streptomyces sp. NPDC058655]|uniref:hypothetical protein n=1 Tax=Streptomyces sp. NPDC058655 TaxID=3346577 RepID=UPI00364CF2FC
MGILVIVANETVPTSWPWAPTVGALTSIIELLTGAPLISIRSSIVVLLYAAPAAGRSGFPAENPPRT